MKHITIITRDIDENYSTGIIDLSNIIQQNGLKLILKKGLYKKFAVIDRDVVWYGSINILGNNTEEESIMRLKNSGIACELVNDYSNFDTEIPVQQRFI